MAARASSICCLLTLVWGLMLHVVSGQLMPANLDTSLTNSDLESLLIEAQNWRQQQKQQRLPLRESGRVSDDFAYYPDQLKYYSGPRTPPSPPVWRRSPVIGHNEPTQQTIQTAVPTANSANTRIAGDAHDHNAGIPPAAHIDVVRQRGDPEVVPGEEAQAVQTTASTHAVDTAELSKGGPRAKAAVDRRFVHVHTDVLRHQLQPNITVTQHNTAKKLSDIYFIVTVSGLCLLVVIITIGSGFLYHKLRKRAKEADDTEFPAYGVTGPSKEAVGSPTDRKLAQSAQMYHYQHQKQQMLAMEKSQSGRHGSASDVDSDDENDEGDYTVYECPGLAPSGEMEVKNPLFHDDPTPAQTTDK